MIPVASSTNYAGRVRIRGCALVVRNEELLLVQQQVPTREKPIWLPPGGEVELGETAKDAAKRETFEETGIKIEPTRLVAVHEFVEPPYHAVELYFLSETIGGTLKTGIDPELSEDDQQILDVAFIPFDQLINLPVSPDFIEEIHQLLASAEECLKHHITSPENRY